MKEHNLVTDERYACEVCRGFYCWDMLPMSPMQQLKPCKDCIQNHYACMVVRAKTRETVTKAINDLARANIFVKETRCLACESRIHTSDETCKGDNGSKDWLDVLASIKTKM